jgi:HlyD family secretion protein
MKALFVLFLGAAAVIGAAAYLSEAPPCGGAPEGLLQARGHLAAAEVNVSTLVGGQVIESRLAEGTVVEAGELLLRVDERDLRLQLDQAQRQAEAVAFEQAIVAEDVHMARQHLQTAEAELERSQTLFAAASVTPAQLRQIESRVEELRGRLRGGEVRLARAGAELAVATRQMEILQRKLDQARIVSPIAGTVLAREIQVGELAAAGQRVAVVADLSRLQLIVPVPEHEIARLAPGDEARVLLNAYPNRWFEASLERIDQRARLAAHTDGSLGERVRAGLSGTDTRTHSVFAVTLGLDNPDGELRPGMSAVAWIRWDPQAEWPEPAGTEPVAPADRPSPAALEDTARLKLAPAAR